MNVKRCYSPVGSGFLFILPTGKVYVVNIGTPTIGRSIKQDGTRVT